MSRKDDIHEKLAEMEDRMAKLEAEIKDLYLALATYGLTVEVEEE